MHPQDYRVVWQILCDGSKSFAMASCMLPRTMRPAVAAVYAFCRQADDLIDRQPHPEQAIAHLQQRLEAIYRQTPQPQAVDRALSEVVATHLIPKHLFEALLEGFLWDVQGRRFANLAQLLKYAARVAGSVGVLMARAMQQTDPMVLERAAALGVAMQLSNIARDVQEDWQNGRVYLPLDWLAQVGLALPTPPWPAAETHLSALRPVMERLLIQSDVYYQLANPAIDCLPRSFTWAIWAASFIYSDINRVVRQQLRRHELGRGYVTWWRKLALLGQAYWRSRQRIGTMAASLSPLQSAPIEFLLRTG